MQAYTRKTRSFLRRVLHISKSGFSWWTHVSLLKKTGSVFNIAPVAVWVNSAVKRTVKLVWNKSAELRQGESSWSGLGLVIQMTSKM